MPKKQHQKSQAQSALIKRSAIALPDQKGELLREELRIRGEAKLSVKGDGQPDLYASFVRQATRIKRLSDEEEHALGVRVRDHHDGEAAKKLVLHNLRLAIKMAHQYRREWANLMDLVQEASHGLAIASKKWDPDMGTRFGTYGAYWIRAQLTKFIMTNGRLIHTAHTRAGRKVFFSLPKIRRELMAKGQAPTVEIIAKEVNEDPKEVALIMSRLSGREASLSTPIDEDGAQSLQDALSSPGASPESTASKTQIQKLLKDVVNKFETTISNARDQSIWHEHLLSNDPKSLVELGTKYGVSKQRMGQLATRLKRSFRRFIIDELGPDTQLSWLFTDAEQ